MLIWTKNNSLTTEFCNHIIDKFENDEERHVGRVGHGVDLNIKNTMDLLISKSDWGKEDEVFYESLSSSLTEYLTQLVPPENPQYGFGMTDTGYQIQKYTPDGFYDWHDDWRFDERLGSRILTYIWYLNTVDEGGWTEFLSGEKIKPEIGKILIFPATWTYVHRGCKPINQDKYICTGWVYNNALKDV